MWNELMTQFVIWLRATWISQLLAPQADWLWALAESFHFVGLALVIGCAGFFDLRLMGFMANRVPMQAARDFIKWAKIGFAMSLTTGLIFFISEPQQYVVKTAWWLKVLFLMIAGANALSFEFVFSKRLDALRPGEDPPAFFRAIGLVSLVSWFAILYFGRMLPYFEPGLNSNL